MNQAYPYPIPNSQSNPASFLVGTTGRLGCYTKPIDARALITIDYGVLQIAAYAFRIRPGGSPQLAIDTVALSTNNSVLTFYLSGGIAGRSYELAILTTLLSTNEMRTDILNVNIPGDDSSCQIVQPVANNGLTSPDGSVYINTAPRMFVSATPPNGARVMDQWWNTTTLKLYSFIADGTTSYWTLL